MLGALLQMACATLDIVRSFTAWNVARTGNAPAPVFASMTFKADGTIVKVGTGDGTERWYAYTSPNIGARFWAKATVTSGSLSTNELSAWTKLDADRELEVLRASVGGASGTFTIEIATDAAGTNRVATWTGNTLSVTVN